MPASNSNYALVISTADPEHVLGLVGTAAADAAAPAVPVPPINGGGDDQPEAVEDVEAGGVAMTNHSSPAGSLNNSRHNSNASDSRSRAESNGSLSFTSIFTRHRSPTFSPAAPDNSPTVLTFTDITVTTKTKPKKILLDSISGSITGGCWAIMGASGGGKTTLLSTLSLRLDPRFMDISGEFRLNGRAYSRQVLKAISAYVMQDDLLHAELTVQETLSYAAELRMPATMTQADRQKRIDEILELMGISHCKNVIIGDSRKKGISGGERKRVCVAIELLNRPKLIFLDEPTSGLDSSTALSVVQALKNLSDQGECTVVCTIHQPQSKIFNLFDNLILMKKGCIIYQGARRKVEGFFDHLGFPVPREEDISTADHILSVIAPSNADTQAFEDHGKKEVPVDLSLGLDKPFFSTKEGARPWIDQVTILFRRNFQQYWRRKELIAMNFVVTVILAVFISCGIWRDIGTGQDSIPKRVPSLFFTCVTQGVAGSLQSINSFPSERAIMLRERQAGAYQVSSYFVAKSVVDMITQLWPPILFSCFTYNLIGYHKSASNFFVYMGFMCLGSNAATALATAVTCYCVSVELSTVVLSFMFEASRLYGGFFASPKLLEQIPDWKFVDALSYLKYTFLGIVINELEDLNLECPAGKKCTYTEGHQIMIAMGYDRYTKEYCAGLLLVLIFGWRLLAYLGLRFIKI